MHNLSKNVMRFAVAGEKDLPVLVTRSLAARASNRRWTRLQATCCAIGLAIGVAGLATPSGAVASEPRSWDFVDGDDFQKGDLDGLALHPIHGLSVAPGLARVDVDAELVHCWLRDGKRLWLGTGVEGKIFVVEGDKAKEVAAVDAALVGSLASDGKGGVYAGLIGKGEIVHVTADFKVTTLVELPDAKHVWALLNHGGQLLAATGPGGKVFAVNVAAKTASVYADTDTEHALVMVEDKGAVLVGTAGSPMLLRIEGEGKIVALASYPGSEVRSIARLNDRIYAAINGNPEVLKLQQLKATPKSPGVDKDKRQTKASQTKTKASGGGLGAVWVRHDDGQLYQHFVSPLGLLGQIGAAGQGVVAGAAHGGRVLIGDLEGAVTTLFDLDEGAVLGVEMGPKGPVTLFTGRSAAVYRVGGTPARSVFTSQVLTASGVARWGRVEAIGSGKLWVETRSGYSNPANDTWSAWQPLANERIQSAPATMFQVRVTLASTDATLSELHLHRQLLNRTPFIEKLDVKFDAKATSYHVNWSARDPDGDKLGYVITYRRRGTTQWLMLHDRYYDKTSLGLSPKDMPDGWYEVRVQASDGPSNTPSEAQQTARISKPFLVDQERPVVVAEAKAGLLSGVATDNTSHIVLIEVSFDGEPPLRCVAGDGVFDGLQEAFELKLPPDIQRGKHTLLIQATDEAGNTGVTRITVGGP